MIRENDYVSLATLNQLVMRSPSIASLFSYHALVSFDKQLHLANLVGDFDWQFDLQSGVLSFADHFHWSAQVLGTESDVSGTWLWSWANEQSGISECLIESSRVLKAFGERHKIPELTEPEVSVKRIDSHMLSLISSGICRANAYYRGPFDGGAAFLLIQDELFPHNAEPPLARIATVCPQAISTLGIPNQRLAFLSFLAFHEIQCEIRGNVVTVEEQRKPKLFAEFDEQNRLTKLEARIEGVDSSSRIAPVE